MVDFHKECIQPTLLPVVLLLENKYHPARAVIFIMACSPLGFRFISSPMFPNFYYTTLVSSLFSVFFKSYSFEKKSMKVQFFSISTSIYSLCTYPSKNILISSPIIPSFKRIFPVNISPQQKGDSYSRPNYIQHN